MKKFIKFIIGLILIPACIGFSRGYINWMSVLKTISENQKYFLYGLFLYLFIHIMFRKPLSVYVFGHELTHAFWTKIFGGEVKSMKVSGKGGEVEISKSNFIITLSPYFFPIYTLIILILFWVLSLIFDSYQNYMLHFLFLLGFSLAFHILLTIEMIRSDQPDLKENGFLFSVSLIYFMNLLVVSALSKMVFFKEYEYVSYLNRSIIESKNIYVDIYNFSYNSITKADYYCKDFTPVVKNWYHSVKTFISNLYT